MSNIGNKETMAKNLSYYLESRGIMQKDLAEVLGVGTSAVNDWVKGKKYPRIDKIEMMANYFGILKSDLIEERTEEDHAMRMENAELTRIILRYKSDNNFAAAVRALNKFDTEKLASLLVFLK